MIAQYSIEGGVSIGHEEGKPTDVWLIYAVPSGTHLKGIDYQNQKMEGFDQVVQ